MYSDTAATAATPNAVRQSRRIGSTLPLFARTGGSLREAAADQGLCSCSRVVVLTCWPRNGSRARRSSNFPARPVCRQDRCRSASWRTRKDRRRSGGLWDQARTRCIGSSNAARSTAPRRSVLNLSGTLLMLHLLRPAIRLRPEWPALPLPGPDGFCGRCVPGSWLWLRRLARPGLPWPA